MGKSSKKRNKKYTGPSAKDTSNLLTVHKVNAVVRSDFMQWLHDHKKLVKWSAIATAVVGVVVFLIVEAIMAMQ
jgi:hypothetical protein